MAKKPPSQQMSLFDDLEPEQRVPKSLDEIQREAAATWRTSLSTRELLVDQVVRDEQALRDWLPPGCPGPEFFRNRIKLYKEAIARIHPEEDK
jgi:hypothetical protein